MTHQGQVNDTSRSSTYVKRRKAVQSREVLNVSGLDVKTRSVPWTPHPAVTQGPYSTRAELLDMARTAHEQSSYTGPLQHTSRAVTQGPYSTRAERLHKAPTAHEQSSYTGPLQHTSRAVTQGPYSTRAEYE